MTWRALGRGPLLILVPGISATYRAFALVLNRLAGDFRTAIYDYPGERPDDHVQFGRITHEGLAADLLGLVEHQGERRAFLLGTSFGATVVLRALHREPDRFPGAVLQGGFARRPFRLTERLALALGRRFSGMLARLPLYSSVLARKQRRDFPREIADRWEHHREQDSLTPIAALAQRLDLLPRLDLRPLLPAIPTEVLLIQGTADRLVPRVHYEELLAGLPHARGVLLPGVGHMPHYTHAEELGRTVADFLISIVNHRPSRGSE
jgi:pimeloyl-ACP methyl ester carboxylesterase